MQKYYLVLQNIESKQATNPEQETKGREETLECRWGSSSLFFPTLSFPCLH